LATAGELHRRSAGAFDIAVARLLQRRGLLPRYPDDAEPGPVATVGADAIELLADGRVRYRDPRVRIDLGGIAKGFAVDRALEVLRQRGVQRGLVNAGGDLAAFGSEAEWIHIRNPKDATRPLCRVVIRDAALATSGPTFDPLHFAEVGDCAVVEPKSGQQVHAIAGASVRAPSCMMADALTKVVMIAGEGAMDLLAHYRASALVVTAAGDVAITADWQDDVRAAA
jgi:thiamine biosynthesis lipoprotein